MRVNMRIVILTLLALVATGAAVYAGTNCTTNCYTVGNQRVCNTQCY